MKTRRGFLLACVAAIAALLPLSGTAAGGQEGSGGFFAHVGDDAASYELPGDVELVASFARPGGRTYERYQQVFGAHRALVLGGQVTVSRDSGGSVATVIGAHYPEISPSNHVATSRAAAARTAERETGPALDRRVELLVDPATGLYQYRVETVQVDHRWFHLIDAESGRVVRRFDALAHTCGSGALQLSGNCGVGVAFDDGDPTDVKDLTGLTSPSGSSHLLQSPLEAGYRRQETHDTGSTRRPFLGPIASDADNSWVTPGDTSPAQPALVDAHYYANVTDDYLAAVHTFDWVARADADAADLKAMVTHAHYSVGYNNAFWNGRYVALGDGDQVTFRELTSLDVVAHEFTHGVTDFTSDLVYENESGALNESFSDIVAAAAEDWAEGTSRETATSLLDGLWEMGEDFDLTTDAVAGFRNMRDPEEDKDPDHYTERYTGTSDNGGVHTNSAIPNHAFHLLAIGGQNASCAAPSSHSASHCTDTADTQDNDVNVAGIGVADAAQVFFEAFITLPENATMCNAREATETKAAALFPEGTEAQSTTNAWLAVGVTDNACGTGGGDGGGGGGGSGTVHVGDLDGAAATQGKNFWRATVTATAHDADHLALSGVTISGTWSPNGSTSCTTDDTGSCSMTLTKIPNSETSVTFTVTSPTEGNHDEDDADASDGTTITIQRP